MERLIPCKIKIPKSDREFDSGTYPVKILEEFLQEIKKKYGANTLVDFDAGHNNICCNVIPSKKVIKENND